LDLLDRDGQDTFQRVLDQLATGERETWNGELQHQISSGEQRWCQLAAAQLPLPSAGGVEQPVANVQLVDITERKQLEAQLAHEALHDPLTRLANRALLLNRLEHGLERLRRHPGVVALLFVDLDRFKMVNDTLGHEAGDELLVQTAARLRSTVRPQDLVARLGGDEFVLLCDELHDASEAETVADRVLAAVSQPVWLQNREVFLSASVGVAEQLRRAALTGAGDDADAAMYQAKGSGRDRYALFDTAAHAAGSEQLQLSGELHRALEREEMISYYQPLVDLLTGEVIAAEGLLRWQHPTCGLLLPGAFLHTAEDTGLIRDLDGWMLSTACRDASLWADRLRRPVGIWINVSARSLADPALPDTVAAALARSRLDPPLLTLEITEGALMQDATTTVRSLEALRALGVQLAVDDFGTGYSSLTYLQRFPVHALRPDFRSWWASAGLIDCVCAGHGVGRVVGTPFPVGTRP
jgi:diguanylate cyclase (GGDEF)-like protein